MPLIPFYLDQITDAIWNTAEKELGETEEVRRETLTQFRNIVKIEPKLYCPDDDTYLLQFLRARKFNLKRAYGLLQNYYHVKKTYPDVYGRPDFEEFMTTITTGLINVLPYRDDDGAIIINLMFDNWEPEKTKFSLFVHGITVVLLACVVHDPSIQICGVKLIFDAKGLGIHTAKYLSPRYLRLLGKGLKNCLPIRFRAIHVINESAVFQYMWSVIRLILSDKIRDRVIFHASSCESLRKHFNPQILPTAYGGQLEYNNKFFIKHMENLENLYYEFHRYGYKSRRNSTEELK